VPVREVIALSRQHGISGFPVVEDGRVVGIVTGRDLRFETRMDAPVREIMTPRERLVTVGEGASLDEGKALMHKHKLERVLVVNDAFELRGLMTVKDILKSSEHPNACKDDLGKLRVGAAVGVGEGTDERVAALVEAGVDLLVVDTAHGHAQAVLDRVKWVKTNFPKTDVIGGNVATAAGARALVDHGADGVKIGIGPGSICTTRIISGVGVPQLTAIADASEPARAAGVPLVADGGIRYSGDITKALAAGANVVMLGGLLAGLDESPGEMILYQGRTFKRYRGMGSLGAMVQGSSERYRQSVTEDDGKARPKLVPEGVEGRVAYKGPLHGLLYQLVGGLRAGMGYLGVRTIDELRTKPRFMRVSAATVRENHPHDIAITQESPNYSMEHAPVDAV
jgi:IMP dehydrogenase